MSSAADMTSAVTSAAAASAAAARFDLVLGDVGAYEQIRPLAEIGLSVRDVYARVCLVFEFIFPLDTEVHYRVKYQP